MKYDVFISYRRATGKDYARIIKPELTTRGLKVFLDMDELKDGKFDKRILDAIEDAPLFMIILSPGALDRCINPDDWVRQEILHAQKCGKHIIPVEVDKSFRSIPDQVPGDIKGIVGQHQFSQVDTETLLKVSMDELVQVRIRPYLEESNVTVVSSGAEVHVETDCTCEVFRFTEKLGVAQKGKDTVFRLHKGTQKLVFRSSKFENAKVEKILKIPDEVYTDIVKVELASIERKIENEIEEKRWREQERIKAERARQRELEMEARERIQAQETKTTIETNNATDKHIKPEELNWLTVLFGFGISLNIVIWGFVFGRNLDLLANDKWWGIVVLEIPIALSGRFLFHFLYRKNWFKLNSWVYDDWSCFYKNNGKWNLDYGAELVAVLQTVLVSIILSIGMFFLLKTPTIHDWAIYKDTYWIEILLSILIQYFVLGIHGERIADVFGI